MLFSCARAPADTCSYIVLIAHSFFFRLFYSLRRFFLLLCLYLSFTLFATFSAMFVYNGIRIDN